MARRRDRRHALVLRDIDAVVGGDRRGGLDHAHAGLPALGDLRGERNSIGLRLRRIFIEADDEDEIGLARLNSIGAGGEFQECLIAETGQRLDPNLQLRVRRQLLPGGAHIGEGRRGPVPTVGLPAPLDDVHRGEFRRLQLGGRAGKLDHIHAGLIILRALVDRAQRRRLLRDRPARKQGLEIGLRQELAGIGKVGFCLFAGARLWRGSIRLRDYDLRPAWREAEHRGRDGRPGDKQSEIHLATPIFAT